MRRRRDAEEDAEFKMAEKSKPENTETAGIRAVTPRD